MTSSVLCSSPSRSGAVFGLLNSLKVHRPTVMGLSPRVSYRCCLLTNSFEKITIRSSCTPSAPLFWLIFEALAFLHVGISYRWMCHQFLRRMLYRRGFLVDCRGIIWLYSIRFSFRFHLKIRSLRCKESICTAGKNPHTPICGIVFANILVLRNGSIGDAIPPYFCRSFNSFELLDLHSSLDKGPPSFRSPPREES